MKKILPILGAVLVIGIAAAIIFVRTAKTPGDNTISAPRTGDNITVRTTPIPLSEVAQHSSPNDCWIAIEGDVYNATSFISDHPGGEEILQGCGTDATALFNNRPDDGQAHSSDARSILAQLKIGTLE